MQRLRKQDAVEKKIVTLHHKAASAIKSGESKFRGAAEYLAKAQQLGATQRQSAEAIGKSPAWVNALLKWRRGGYKDCPFPRSKRRVQPAEQKPARPPTTAAQINKAARYEAVAKIFSPETKRIPSGSRKALISALEMLGSERAEERAAAAAAVERERARLNLPWAELIVPAAEAAETELRLVA